MQTAMMIRKASRLPKREINNIKAFISYLSWRRNGGRKTAEVKHGEKLYIEFKNETKAA